MSGVKDNVPRESAQVRRRERRRSPRHVVERARAIAGMHTSSSRWQAPRRQDHTVSVFLPCSSLCFPVFVLHPSHYLCPTAHRLQRALLTRPRWGEASPAPLFRCSGESKVRQEAQIASSHVLISLCHSVCLGSPSAARGKTAQPNRSLALLLLLHSPVSAVRSHLPVWCRCGRKSAADGGARPRLRLPTRAYRVATLPVRPAALPA